RWMARFGAAHIARGIGVGAGRETASLSDTNVIADSGSDNGDQATRGYPASRSSAYYAMVVGVCKCCVAGCASDVVPAEAAAPHAATVLRRTKCSRGTNGSGWPI